jgi:hypothetical protein
MEEEDYFRDQRRRDRGSNFVGSYRRPGSSEFFNPAGTILAGIEAVESSIGKRKKTVRDFENAAAIRKQEMIAAIQDTEGMEDISAIDSLQTELMAQVDELHRLDIASFEGDRSAYLKKSNEINKIAQTIPALMGLIDAEGVALEEAKMSGKALDKNVLRSNNADYYNFVENASKGGKNISFKIKNGNIIAQLDGKDVFNGNAYVKAKEKGFDLINYAKDYNEQMDKLDAKISKGLTSLISASDLETINKDGLRSTTVQKNNYIKALNAYKEALKNDPSIGALINESTFQTFTEDQDIYSASSSQNQMTKDAIIDYMVKKKFPMYDPNTDTAFGDIKVTTRVLKGKGSGDKEEEVVSDYSDWISSSLYEKADTPYRGDIPESERPIRKMPFEKQEEIILEKIRGFSPSTLRYGDDSTVEQYFGEDADPNKLYELVKYSGGYKVYEVEINENDLKSDEATNNLLVDYGNKYGSRKTKYQGKSRASR